MPVQPRSIFICYRRDDSADIAGRIFDRLVHEFGREAIFRDVDNIPYGVDFREHVQSCLASSRIGLVVIGPLWSGIKDADGHVRLHEPADHVRLEIEGMLARKELLTIPLFVGGGHPPQAAALPESLQPLTYLNGPEIRRDPDFHHDMDRLVAQLQRRLATPLPVEKATTAALPAPEPKAELPTIKPPPATPTDAPQAAELQKAKRLEIFGVIFFWILVLALIGGAITLLRQIPDAYRWVAAKVRPATTPPPRIILPSDWTPIFPTPSPLRGLGTPKTSIAPDIRYFLNTPASATPRRILSYDSTPYEFIPRTPSPVKITPTPAPIR